MRVGSPAVLKDGHRSWTAFCVYAFEILERVLE